MIILNVLTVNRKWLDGWALLVIPGIVRGGLMDNVLERRKERLDDLLVDVAELRELVGKLKGENEKLKGCLNNCKIVMLKMPMAWFSSNDHKSLMEAQKCLKELDGGE